ncbi:MAG TPA: multiheme c-type cytochrome [Candidatus Hypogeohydataceae bacterium YC41]
MHRGRIIFSLVVALTALLVLKPSLSSGAAAQKWKYVGNKGCKCHLSPGCFEGDEYKKIKHSEAFKSLKTEEEQKDTNCLKCHATGHGQKMKDPKLTYLENVACEACHGPGEGYAEVKNDLAKGVKDYAELAKKYELKEKGKKAFNELLAKDPMMARKVQYDAGLVVAGINNPEGTIKAQCLECHWEKEDDKDRCPKAIDEKTGKPKVFNLEEAFKKDDHRDEDEIDKIVAKMSPADKSKWKGYIERDPILNSPLKPEAKAPKKKAAEAED